MNLKYNWRLWKTFYIINFRYMVQSLNKLDIKLNVDWSRLCSSVSICFKSVFSRCNFPILWYLISTETTQIVIIMKEQNGNYIWRVAGFNLTMANAVQLVTDRSMWNHYCQIPSWRQQLFKNNTVIPILMYYKTEWIQISPDVVDKFGRMWLLIDWWID